MSTLSNILTFSRTQAQTDSSGITDANGIIFANEALFDFRRRLVDKGIDALGIQEAYRDASIPTLGNGSTYLYPADAMFLKAIEINYQDTSAGNYVKAEQVDHSNIPGGSSFSWLRLNQSTQYPLFADNGDWYEIFPAFTSGNNTSQAIRIIYFQKPTEYVATTDSVNYPESLDYRILGWRIAANYLYSLRTSDNIATGDKFMARYEERVKQFTGTLGRGAQQPLTATPIQLTGGEF